MNERIDEISDFFNNLYGHKAYLDKVVDQALLDLLKSDYPKVYDHVQQLIANFEETIQQIDPQIFGN